MKKVAWVVLQVCWVAINQQQEGYISMIKLINIFFFLVFSTFGCTAINEMIVPDIKIQEATPTQKISRYSNALEQIGEFLETVENPFAMMVEPILDKTGSGAGKIPHDLTLVVESALQNVGPSLMLMPHETLSLKVAEQNGLPIYSIHGAITEFDAATVSKSVGNNVGLYHKDTDIGLDLSQDISSGTIAMDFMVLDRGTNVYLSGIKATAKGSIEKQSKGRGFSFCIIGNGFGLNGNTNSQTPVHHMVNIMVEYCMIQLIGQMKSTPYWLFIQDCDPDYRQLRKLEKKFKQKPEHVKNAICTYILSKIDPSIKGLQNEIDIETKMKIIQYKQKFGVIPTNEKVTSKFYVKLLTDGIKMIKQNKITNQADNLLNSVLE